MLKYFFLCIALCSIAFGVREFWNTTQDLIDCHENISTIFQKLHISQISILEERTFSFTASKHSVVSIILLNNKKIAVSDIPQNVDTFLIKRDPGLDYCVKDKFSESINAYETVYSIPLYFFSHYVISLFLLIFGLLFFIGACVMFQESPYDKK
ncbi:secreted protein [Candidatus Magnetomorum sp. HK-1]|nr:secreted protein [Candidatus Magnetomorum sp. HK-1]